MTGISLQYQYLKSGSDVRGTAVGEDAKLTDAIVTRLGAAFTRFLAKKYGKPENSVSVAIGRDSRITGPHLMEAACQGIAATGATAYDCGMCTTPSMFMAILEPGFTPTGSIMITASHHPWNINGMKFFTEAGGVGYQDLELILKLAEEGIPDVERQEGRVQAYPYIAKYRMHLEAFIRERVGREGSKTTQRNCM